MKEKYFITLHCRPVSYIYKLQYFKSVLPDLTEQCDRKCMNCNGTELKLDRQGNFGVTVAEDESH